MTLDYVNLSKQLTFWVGTQNPTHTHTHIYKHHRSCVSRLSSFSLKREEKPQKTTQQCREHRRESLSHLAQITRNLCGLIHLQLVNNPLNLHNFFFFFGGGGWGFDWLWNVLVRVLERIFLGCFCCVICLPIGFLTGSRRIYIGESSYQWRSGACFI